MKFLKLLKNILIQGQFFVTLMATFLAVFILEEQNAYQITLVVILFLTFWNGYFFTVFHKKKDAIFWNWVGFALISFLIFNNLNSYIYVKWLIVLFLELIYNADFFNINLRQFSLIKTFYVGFVWAMTLVWLPLGKFDGNDVLFSSDFVLRFINSSLCDFINPWFLIVFFFISAITFPFEIRDLERDDFPTLPKKIGIQNTKYLSYIFLFLSSVLAIQFLKIDFAISFFLTNILAFILIYFSDRKRKDWYYSILMESLSMFPFLISHAMSAKIIFQIF